MDNKINSQQYSDLYLNLVLGGIVQQHFQMNYFNKSKEEEQEQQKLQNQLIEYLKKINNLDTSNQQLLVENENLREENKQIKNRIIELESQLVLFSNRPENMNIKRNLKLRMKSSLSIKTFQKQTKYRRSSLLINSTLAEQVSSDKLITRLNNIQLIEIKRRLSLNNSKYQNEESDLKEFINFKLNIKEDQQTLHRRYQSIQLMQRKNTSKFKCIQDINSDYIQQQQEARRSLLQERFQDQSTKLKSQNRQVETENSQLLSLPKLSHDDIINDIILSTDIQFFPLRPSIKVNQVNNLNSSIQSSQSSEQNELPLKNNKKPFITKLYSRQIEENNNDLMQSGFDLLRYAKNNFKSFSANNQLIPLEEQKYNENEDYQSIIVEEMNLNDQDFLIRNQRLSNDYEHIHESKDSSNNFQKDLNDRLGDKLLESFFILGPNRQDIIDQIESQNHDNLIIDSGILPSSIVYQYPHESQIKDQNVLGSFMTSKLMVQPFGVKVDLVQSHVNQVIDEENIRFKLYDEIFQKNKQILDYKNSFMIAHGTEEHYQTSAKENINPTLLQINPELKIFIICVKVRDYILTPCLNEPEVLNFWIFEKVLCVISYYPFQKLFFDLIDQFLNNLNIQKQSVLGFGVQDNMTYQRLDQVDFSSLPSLIENSDDMIQLLEDSIDKSYVPENPQQGFVIQSDIFFTQNQEISYKFKYHKNITPYSMMPEIATLSFSLINFKDFMFLIFNMLLDKKVVLFSKDEIHLTSVILTLQNAIMPFKWVFPSISIMPENFVYNIYDAPTPFIGGALLENLDNFNQKIIENNLDIIFYDIKNEKILNKNTQALKASIPKFTMYKQLKQEYFQINSRLSPNFHTFHNYRFSIKKFQLFNVQKKILIYEPNTQQERHAIEIIQQIGNLLRKNIIDHLNVPVEQFLRTRQNDSQRIDREILKKHVIHNLQYKNKTKHNIQFIQQFFDRISFTYYLDQMIDKMSKNQTQILN